MNRKVDQTILHDQDLKRPGNCFAACVATALNRHLVEVPHFAEWGQWFHNGNLRDETDEDRKYWLAMFWGYAAGAGVWPVDLECIEDAKPDEIVFTAGMSPRGIRHQVLYRNGVLWHDPHPSHDGLVEADEWFVLRPSHDHDHKPTGTEDLPHD